MAYVDNFIPKLPILSSLGRNLSSVMSCPIFSPSKPVAAPNTQPHPSKYCQKHVSPPPSKKGGGLTSHSTPTLQWGWWGGGRKVYN